MSLIIPANTLASGGYDVANSLRFNDGSSDYLNLSLGTPSNRKIFTCSAWVKRASTGTYPIFWFGADSDNWFMVKYESDSLRIESKSSGSTIIDVRTNALYRDFSAWYHVLVAVDTSQGTASNRIKIYVNGVQETSLQTSTYPNQNTDLNVITTAEIGNQHTTQYFDGYMAEVVFVDGTQQANTDLGEFDEDSGIWKPIDVSGLTFGTNGFYLDFENSGALGADVSGNGNDFTVNNLAAIDQSTDTCTNNFATANPLVVIGNTGQTYADGNLTFNASGTNWTATNSTIGASQGKWYAEFKVVTLASSTGYGNLGITGTENITNGNFISTEANSVGLGLDHRAGNNVAVYSGGSFVQYAGADFAAGAIVGIAVDMDNKKFYLSHNGTYLTVGGSVGDPTSGSTGTGAFTIPAGIETFLFAVGGYSTSFKGTWNFGSPPYAISSGNTDGNGYGNMEFAVPSGYYAINTKNLAEYG